MSFSVISSIALFGFIASLLNVNALPWDKPPPICEGAISQPISGGQIVKYDVTSKLQNQPGPPVTGEYSCPGTGGSCAFTTGNQYSVGVTVEVGFDLGLSFEKIASEAGISGSVSTTTESATSQGVGKTCPDGPWVCALIITPPVTIVEGTQWYLDDNCREIPGTDKPYKIALPEHTSQGLLTGAQVDICACKNFKHWADAGAPSIVCPQDCVA